MIRTSHGLVAALLLAVLGIHSSASASLAEQVAPVEAAPELSGAQPEHGCGHVGDTCTVYAEPEPLESEASEEDTPPEALDVAASGTLPRFFEELDRCRGQRNRVAQFRVRPGLPRGPPVFTP